MWDSCLPGPWASGRDARCAAGRDLLPDPAAELEAIVAAQAAVIVELRAANAALAARVDELERQLAKHSGNSSRPPSSDGLTKPPAPKRARQPGMHRPGKQPGAPGTHLAQVPEPDEVVEHLPNRCGGCDADLAGAPVVGVEARQVFDLPRLRMGWSSIGPNGALEVYDVDEGIYQVYDLQARYLPLTWQAPNPRSRWAGQARLGPPQPGREDGLYDALRRLLPGIGRADLADAPILDLQAAAQAISRAPGRATVPPKTALAKGPQEHPIAGP